MDLIKAIIVDDERAAREVLAALLSQYSDSIQVLASCVDLPSAVDHIKRYKPDVVFLDVQMPEYAGYEIARFFDEIDFEIVFVTAYDQFAIKAFELNAIDYIVKPIERKRLNEAIERIRYKVSSKKQVEDYSRLLETIQSGTPGKIIISESGRRYALDMAKIIAIKASGSYCMVLTENGDEIMVSKNLKHFEKLLLDSKLFFRSHRTWLINVKHIIYYKRTELEVILTNDIVAKISRKKLNEFISFI